jgi:hypothetical protein
VRQAAALGFDSMEFLSFPSAYQPDLHSKAADSWIVEVRRWASADRLPHGPIVIEFRPPLLGVLGAYCTPAMSGRKTQEHPARPQAQHERSYKPEQGARAASIALTIWTGVEGARQNEKTAEHYNQAACAEADGANKLAHRFLSLEFVPPSGDEKETVPAPILFLMMCWVRALRYDDGNLSLGIGSHASRIDTLSRIAPIGWAEAIGHAHDFG